MGPRELNVCDIYNCTYVCTSNFSDIIYFGQYQRLRNDPNIEFIHDSIGFHPEYKIQSWWKLIPWNICTDQTKPFCTKLNEYKNELALAFLFQVFDKWTRQ